MLRRVPRASWTRWGLPSPGADTQKMMGALVDRKLAQGRAAAISVPVLQRAQELVPLMCDNRRGIVAEEPIDARKRASWVSSSCMVASLAGPAFLRPK